MVASWGRAEPEMYNNTAWKIRKRRKKSSLLYVLQTFSMEKLNRLKPFQTGITPRGFQHQTLVLQGWVDEPALLSQHRRIRLFPFAIMVMDAYLCRRHVQCHRWARTSKATCFSPACSPYVPCFLQKAVFTNLWEGGVVLLRPLLV